MHAPNEVLDLLESILGIFFYDIRYKERSVFILCDNLVELCCKTKIKQNNFNADVKNMSLRTTLLKTQIGAKLRERFLSRREIRNDMQHQLAGITIDKQQCADAIIDLVSLINHRKMWGKYAFDPAPNWVFCGLRIVKLYSRAGDNKKRKIFEDKLQREVDWDEEKIVENGDIQPGIENIQREMAILSRDLVNLDGSPVGKKQWDSREVSISVGLPEHWTYLIKEFTERVMFCMDELDVDEI